MVLDAVLPWSFGLMTHPESFKGKIAKWFCFLIVALVTSTIVFFINMSTGAFAVGSIGTQLQASIVSSIETHMKGLMGPLRINLQQGAHFWEDSGLDLRKWSNLQQTEGIPGELLR